MFGNAIKHRLPCLIFYMKNKHIFFTSITHHYSCTFYLNLCDLTLQPKSCSVSPILVYNPFNKSAQGSWTLTLKYDLVILLIHLAYAIYRMVTVFILDGGTLQTSHFIVLNLLTFKILINLDLSTYKLCGACCIICSLTVTRYMQCCLPNVLMKT